MSSCSMHWLSNNIYLSLKKKQNHCFNNFLPNWLKLFIQIRKINLSTFAIVQKYLIVGKNISIVKEDTLSLSLCHINGFHSLDETWPNQAWIRLEKNSNSSRVTDWFDYADWHKTQTKYRSKSQPFLDKIALILSA